MILTIDFQDGNGDLGMTQDEFSGTKVTSPSLKGINNYEVKVFRAKNGTFSEVQFSPSLSGFIPFYFKPDGKSGPIEGTVDYSIAFLHAFTPKKDTLKFEVRIRDRALNYSNSVQSSQIVLNSD
ncbi:hypothetical protein ACFFJX_19410 [Pseudarcicella hirudinis]|uniref:hypothetical protein n=1 Tax=Pseudarcicella hirudinis TaxID=1079859 RepID=UPI0035F07F05